MTTHRLTHPAPRDAELAMTTQLHQCDAVLANWCVDGIVMFLSDSIAPKCCVINGSLRTSLKFVCTGNSNLVKNGFCVLRWFLLFAPLIVATVKFEIVVRILEEREPGIFGG